MLFVEYRLKIDLTEDKAEKELLNRRGNEMNRRNTGPGNSG
jgi:hypothetical protein